MKRDTNDYSQSILEGMLDDLRAAKNIFTKSGIPRSAKDRLSLAMAGGKGALKSIGKTVTSKRGGAAALAGAGTGAGLSYLKNKRAIDKLNAEAAAESDPAKRAAIKAKISSLRGRMVSSGVLGAGAGVGVAAAPDAVKSFNRGMLNPAIKMAGRNIKNDTIGKVGAAGSAISRTLKNAKDSAINTANSAKNTVVGTVKNKLVGPDGLPAPTAKEIQNANVARIAAKQNRAQSAISSAKKSGLAAPTAREIQMANIKRKLEQKQAAAREAFAKKNK